MTPASAIINNFLMKRLVHFPQGPVNHYKSFQCNLKIKKKKQQ